MKKKASIHDIARKLNVSATTVSFVLNGRAKEKRISEEVRKKVEQYVEKTGYHRNMAAISLRTGKSGIIGMMVEYIADPFFSSIAQLIEKKAYSLGYKILYSSTENNTEKAKELIRVYRERQVDGYIIAPAPGIEDDIRQLMKEKVPVVMFDRCFPELETWNVLIDNEGGCYNAVNYLMKRGYKQIAFVTLDSNQVQMTDRLRGYTKAIKEKYRMPLVTKLPFAISNKEREQQITAFLKAHKQVDAILFATNYLAISGLQSIYALQLKVPERIGVISFDDNTYFDLFSPSITAVAQPVEEIADNIIQLLWQKLDEAPVKKKQRGATIVLPTKLMIRNSAIKKSNRIAAKK